MPGMMDAAVARIAAIAATEIADAINIVTAARAIAIIIPAVAIGTGTAVDAAIHAAIAPGVAARVVIGFARAVCSAAMGAIAAA